MLASISQSKLLMDFRIRRQTPWLPVVPTYPSAVSLTTPLRLSFVLWGVGIMRIPSSKNYVD